MSDGVKKAIEDYDKRHENTKKVPNREGAPDGQIPPMSNAEEDVKIYGRITEERVVIRREVNKEFSKFNKNIANETIDFVETSNNNILKFIQGSVRAKRILISLNEEVKKARDDKLLVLKSEAQTRLEVKELGGIKERELAVNKIVHDEFDNFYSENIGILEDMIDSYNNEINLAKEIFKLKSLINEG